jgi:hypothetical protein
MIILVQGLGFASPLIVKAILDDYIMGIEYNWNEVTAPDDKAVVYDGRYFIQTRHLDDDDIVIGPASLVLYKTSIYFVEDEVVEDKCTLKTGNYQNLPRSGIFTMMLLFECKEYYFLPTCRSDSNLLICLLLE